MVCRGRILSDVSVSQTSVSEIVYQLFFVLYDPLPSSVSQLVVESTSHLLSKMRHYETVAA